MFGEAANHSLHRLLQHRRVPRVTVAGGPRPQPRSQAAVQAVELQRRGWWGRPGRSGQGGRRGQQRRDGDRNPGPERWAQGPGRSWSESDPRLQPLRADTVRDHVRFHCPNVTSAKSGGKSAPINPTASASVTLSPKAKGTKWWQGFVNHSLKKHLSDADSTHTTAAVHPQCLD